MNEIRTYRVFVNPHDSNDRIFVPAEYIMDSMTDLSIDINDGMVPSMLSTSRKRDDFSALKNALRLVREDVRPIIKDYCKGRYGMMKTCYGCKFSYGDEPTCFFTECPDSWDI